jgi:hypothetical protein
MCSRRRRKRASRLAVPALAALAAVAGCRDGDIFGGTRGNRVVITSDPPGARIIVDGRNTGRTTPDTLRGLTGQRDINVRLDMAGFTYGYNARLALTDDDSITYIHGPLLLRCFETPCYRSLTREYTAGRMRVWVNPAGMLFHRDNRMGNGLTWPAPLGNGYVSIGMPAFAAIADGRDTVSLGVYDTPYLAGRPGSLRTAGADSLAIVQAAWVVPPSRLLARPTLRGIEIEQHVIASPRVEDVAYVRLVFRNITDRHGYRAIDPVVPPGGIVYEAAYIGLAVDVDIGGPADDWFSYAPGLDMVFAWDVRFEEDGFGGGWDRRPGLVGLRVLERPPGSTAVLNGWPGAASGVTGDWSAGSMREGLGWDMYSGLRAFPPSHPHRSIGHLPTAAADIRLSATAGPVRLAPGDSAAIVLAVILAEPQPGTFIPGAVVTPGDPFDGERPIAIIAKGLFDRARDAAARRPVEWLRPE